MRKAISFASLGVALVVAVNAFGQHEEFAYSQENQWVRDSLNRMAGKGILVGFRSFIPRRDPHQAQTRIVIAMATHAAYSKLLGMKGRLQQWSDEISQINDVEVAHAELAKLKEQVRGFDGYDEDLRDLLKLSRTFSKELQDLGVNVLEMRGDLSDMRSRTRSGWRASFAKKYPRFGSKQKPRSFDR